MNKQTIFISHITEEKEIAKTLKEFLEQRFLKTINVFASSHEESIKLGDDWLSAIKKSMKDCKLIIIICSPISITRPWINFEAGSGWIREIPVIPLCHSGLTPSKLPIPMNSFQGGFINSKEDIKKLFNRIAELLDMNAPNSNEESFYSAIDSLETNIKNTALIHDTTFIYHLLSRQITLLKYSIYASTLDYEELKKVNLEHSNIKGHKYIFHDIYNLFNTSLLMIFNNKAVFQIYYETVKQLADNVKFVLTYKNVNVAPRIQEILNWFLFSFMRVDDWYDGITIQNYNANNGIKNLAINMIKESSLPPVRKTSNVINYFIDYYECLLLHQEWILEYENEINNILKVKTDG